MQFLTWAEVIEQKFAKREQQKALDSVFYWIGMKLKDTPDLPISGNTGINVLHDTFTYIGQIDEDGEEFSVGAEITISPQLLGNPIDELYSVLHRVGATRIGEGSCTFDRATAVLTKDSPWFYVVTPIGYEFDKIKLVIEGYGVVRTRHFPTNCIVHEKVVSSFKKVLKLIK